MIYTSRFYEACNKNILKECSYNDSYMYNTTGNIDVFVVIKSILAVIHMYVYPEFPYLKIY